MLGALVIRVRHSFINKSREEDIVLYGTFALPDALITNHIIRLAQVVFPFSRIY